MWVREFAHAAVDEGHAIRPNIGRKRVPKIRNIQPKVRPQKKRERPRSISVNSFGGQIGCSANKSLCRSNGHKHFVEAERFWEARTEPARGFVLDSSLTRPKSATLQANHAWSRKGKEWKKYFYLHPTTMVQENIVWFNVTVQLPGKTWQNTQK